MQNFPNLTRRLVFQEVLEFLLDGKRQPSPTCGPDLTTSVIDLQLLDRHFYDVVIPLHFERLRIGQRWIHDKNFERDGEISTLDLFRDIAISQPFQIIRLHRVLQDRYVVIHGFHTRHFPRIDIRIFELPRFNLREQALMNIWFEHMA